MRHVVIQASAGSGKTFQLSSSYLGLLLDPTGNVRVSEILATTFTRKAAGEIQRRVLERLAGAAASDSGAKQLCIELIDGKFLPPEASLSKERASVALEFLVSDFSQMRISTLDGFFSQIAGAMGVDLGFPLAWQLADEEEVQRIRRDAWRDVLRLWGSAKTIRLVRALTRQGFARSVAKRLDKAIGDGVDWWRETRGRPDVWRIPAHPVLVPDAMRVERCKSLTDALIPLLPLTKTGTVKAVWKKAILELQRCLNSGDWEAILKLGLMGKIHSGETSFAKSEITEEVAVMLREIRALAADGVSVDLQELTEMYYQFNAAAGERYAVLRYERGLYGFTDVTEQIQRGLSRGEETEAFERWLDLYYRLDSKIQHLLVDEFQDTSRSQWSILSPVIEEICADSERALLAVGDAKQSIYGWRGGVRELLAVLAEDVKKQGGESLSMSKNWRSSPVLMGIVNHVFSDLAARPMFEDWADEVSLWSREAGQTGQFPIHVAAHEQMRGGGWLHVSRVVVGPVEAIREAISDTAVRVVVDCLANTTGQIAILYRSRKGMASLATKLNRAGIDCSYEAGGTVCDAPSVLLVESCLAFVSHPEDTGSFFHVTNSPLGQQLGLSNALVFDDEAGRLVWARAQRKKILDIGLGEYLKELCQLLASQLSPDSHERDLSRLSQLVDLAWQFEEKNGADIDGFLQYIQSQRVTSVRAVRVRLLTIHQSKGLEFETVILPDLESNMLPKSRTFLGNRPNPLAPLDQVCVSGRAETRSSDSRLEQLFRNQQAEGIREELSAFYVAMTRAQRFLHLIISPAPVRGVKLSAASVLRDCFDLGEASSIPLSDDSCMVKVAEPEDFGAVELKKKSLKTKLITRDVSFLRPSDTGGNFSDSAYLGGWDSSLSKACGSALHVWLAELEWLSSKRAFKTGKDPHSLIVGLDKETSGRLWNRLSEALSSDAVAEALSQPAADGRTSYTVYPELPYVREGQDVLVSGVIDRVVTLTQGTKVVGAQVLEYKSAGLHHNEPINVEKYVEKYRSQVEEYCRTVQGLFGIESSADIEGYLVLLGCNAVVKI